MFHQVPSPNSISLKMAPLSGRIVHMGSLDKSDVDWRNEEDCFSHDQIEPLHRFEARLASYIYLY